MGSELTPQHETLGSGNSCLESYKDWGFVMLTIRHPFPGYSLRTNEQEHSSPLADPDLNGLLRTYAYTFVRANDRRWYY